MPERRIAALEELRARLGSLLGEDTLLYRRFDTALRRRDPELAGAAMDSLRLYPPAMRRRVEEALLAWLFSSNLAPVATLPADAAEVGD